MTKRIGLFSVALFLGVTVPSGGHAVADPAAKVRTLTSVYMSLTGEPAPEAVIAEVLDGRTTLEEVAQQLQKDSRFHVKFARYWTRVLGINAPFSLGTIRDASTNVNFNTAALMSNTTLFGHPVQDWLDEGKVEALRVNLNTRNFPRIRNNRALTCNGKRIERIFTTLSLNDGTAVNAAISARNTGKVRIDGVDVTVSAALKTKYTEIANLMEETFVCPCDKLAEVKPYWDPNGTITVCRGITAARFCGPNMEKCWSESEDQSTLRDPVRLGLTESFALEPGMMIAKIVSEDKNYDEVLRTREGVVNPIMKYTLQKYWNFWKGVMPPGSYPALQGEQASRFVDVDSRDYQWVDRGPLHAGVLTTMALHRVTNGWRAKANRVMDAFMCRAFVVPDGVKVVPSEEAELIRMPYCQSCHATLEPLSQFFGRWPNLGMDSNYYYDPSPGASAVGRLAGKEDADTRGLGFIMSSLPDFNECAVKRAFEFSVGRQMTAYEEQTILPEMTTKFVESGKKLWPVIKDFVIMSSQQQ